MILLPSNPTPEARRGKYVAMRETDAKPRRRRARGVKWLSGGRRWRVSVPWLTWSPEPAPRIVGVLLDRKLLVVEVECA